MKSIQSFIHFPVWHSREAQGAGNLLFSFMPINIPNNNSLHLNVHISFWLSVLVSVRGEGEVKKNSNILCDRNCKLCCWDMKIQVLTGYHAATVMPWCIFGQVNSFDLPHSFTGNTGNRESDDSTNNRPGCTASPSHYNHCPGYYSKGKCNDASRQGWDGH